MTEIKLMRGMEWVRSGQWRYLSGELWEYQKKTWKGKYYALFSQIHIKALYTVHTNISKGDYPSSTNRQLL